MKELEVKPKDKTEVSRQSAKEIKSHLIGRAFPHPGHRCFEYNTEENTLRIAVFMGNTSVDFFSAQTIKKSKKIMVVQGCHYVTALNFKNAIKHLNKRLGYNIRHLYTKLTC